MKSLRPLLLGLFATLAACGEAETPEAAPGAVERTAEALDRNAAAEREQTIRRLDAEAEARASQAERRIEASEKERLSGD